MEEHVLGITRLVNHLLGPLVLSLLHALHITPENPELPIPQHVVMGLVVLADRDACRALSSFPFVDRKARRHPTSC